MNLGNRIRAWRIAKGKTQKQLAEAAGVTVSAVCLWEKGGNITHSHLAAIVDALGITMGRFYAHTPPKAKAA